MATRIYLKPEFFFRIAPLLLGLAVAYAASGYLAGKASGPSADGHIHIAAQGEAASDSSARDALIMSRNVLALHIPPTAEEEAQTARQFKDGDPADWQLGATFVGARPMILLTVDAKTDLIALGTTVKGWELALVETDRIVWKKGEVERIIHFLDEEGKAETKTASAGGTSGVYYPQREEGRFETSNAEIRNVLKDPAWLMQQALYKPHMTNGKFDGFVITNIRPNSILNNVGFMNGDILKRINGQDITGPQSLMQLYDGMPNAESLRLDVLRDGGIKSLLIVLK